MALARAPYFSLVGVIYEQRHTRLMSEFWRFVEGHSRVQCAVANCGAVEHGLAWFEWLCG